MKSAAVRRSSAAGTTAAAWSTGSMITTSLDWSDSPPLSKESVPSDTKSMGGGVASPATPVTSPPGPVAWEASARNVTGDVPGDAGAALTPTPPRGEGTSAGEDYQRADHPPALQQPRSQWWQEKEGNPKAQKRPAWGEAQPRSHQSRAGQWQGKPAPESEAESARPGSNQAIGRHVCALV